MNGTPIVIGPRAFTGPRRVAAVMAWFDDDVREQRRAPDTNLTLASCAGELDPDDIEAILAESDQRVVEARAQFQRVAERFAGGVA